MKKQMYLSKKKALLTRKKEKKEGKEVRNCMYYMFQIVNVAVS